MPMNAASIAGKDTRFVNSCTLKWCASRISAEFYGSGELFGLILAHRERLERLDGKHNSSPLGRQPILPSQPEAPGIVAR